MSSSPLLTITESHGFRALVAAIIFIIGGICLFGRGLRTLACTNEQRVDPETRPKSWRRILLDEIARVRREPVLWFDTSGGREGPGTRGLHPQLLLVYCDLYHSPARPLADQAMAAGCGWSDSWT